VCGSTPSRRKLAIKGSIKAGDNVETTTAFFKECGVDSDGKLSVTEFKTWSDAP
jgi:hypothetical protein